MNGQEYLDVEVAATLTAARFEFLWPLDATVFHMLIPELNLLFLVQAAINQQMNTH